MPPLASDAYYAWGPQYKDPSPLSRGIYIASMFPGLSVGTGALKLTLAVLASDAPDVKTFKIATAARGCIEIAGLTPLCLPVDYIFYHKRAKAEKNIQ